MISPRRPSSSACSGSHRWTSSLFSIRSRLAAA
jgi:hypothetical protein